MRQPDIYSASTIKNWDVDKKVWNGAYVPTRPVGHSCFSWKWRFKLAWYVLIGKYDVLLWE